MCYEDLVVALLYVQVSSIALENPDFFRKLIFLPFIPVYLFEEPLFSKVSSHDSVFVSYVPRYELVKEPEEFVNLLFRKVGVVAGVFYFKSVGVFTFSGHYVG